MELSAEVTIRTATFGAVRKATEGSLCWKQVESDTRRAAIPEEQGVYVWVDAHDAVLFTGKATGARGLRARLALELGALWKHQDRPEGLAGDFDPGDYVPGLRYLYRHVLTVWFATTTVSTFPRDPDANLWSRRFHDLWEQHPEVAQWDIDPGAPRTGTDWEAAIQALCAELGDLRSVIGGGSWEAARGSRGVAALSWAHHRHLELTGTEVSSSVRHVTAPDV